MLPFRRSSEAFLLRLGNSVPVALPPISFKIPGGIFGLLPAGDLRLDDLIDLGRLIALRLSLHVEGLVVDLHRADVLLTALIKPRRNKSGSRIFCHELPLDLRKLLLHTVRKLQ